MFGQVEKWTFPGFLVSPPLLLADHHFDCRETCGGSYGKAIEITLTTYVHTWSLVRTDYVTIKFSKICRVVEEKSKVYKHVGSNVRMCCVGVTGWQCLECSQGPGENGTNTQATKYSQVIMLASWLLLFTVCMYSGKSCIFKLFMRYCKTFKRRVRPKHNWVLLCCLDIHVWHGTHKSCLPRTEVGHLRRY